MTAPLSPGATIGIFGSGQLGRMLAIAAARLGLQTHIYAPTGHESPAAQVATTFTTGAYDNTERVTEFVKSCDVVTYEFENIPAETAQLASTFAPLLPSATCLDVSQDRLTEKTFISTQAQVPVAPFEAVSTLSDVKRVLKTMNGKCVLKTRRFGYDGKGQAVISNETEAEEAWNTLGHVPIIAEAFIPFQREVSIVCARSVNKQTAAYPLIENVHQNHILHTSTAPTHQKTEDAHKLAIKIMDKLDYVGVMATEFFELEDGSLIVNEIAPRVHNSGHWTQDAGCTDQFEQHIRAVAGWPLGSTTPLHKVEMTNLIGPDIEDWQDFASKDKTFLHLYGKKEARDGRKMGHINRIIS